MIKYRTCKPENQNDPGRHRHQVAVQSIGVGQYWLLIPALSLTHCATWADNLTSLSLRSLTCKIRTTSLLSTMQSCCKD